MAVDDFFSSAVRHFDDCSRLYAAGRIDEAAYLAGYVIECGLKKLLEVQRGSTARAYGHDLRGMTGQGLALAALLAPASVRYRVDMISSLSTAMNYWKPELRYWTTGDVRSADAMVMFEAAMGVMRDVILALMLDGNESGLR